MSSKPSFTSCQHVVRPDSFITFFIALSVIKNVYIAENSNLHHGKYGPFICTFAVQYVRCQILQYSKDTVENLAVEKSVKVIP